MEEKFDIFKHNLTDSRIFSVTIEGERANDGGGPYRDVMSNICKEFQSGVLPLLIPTPNNKNNHGDNR